MTPDQQQLLEEIFFIRGMIVGLQRSLLTILKTTLSPREIEKISEELERLPAVLDDAARELRITKGAALPTSYQRGMEEGQKPFLIEFTRSDSRSE